MKHPKRSPVTVVFDLGGVLLDWDPRHLYRKLFNGDEAAMESFLAEICTTDWHYNHDLGRSFDEGAKLLYGQHPEKTALIKAWGERFDEMVSGSIENTVDILAELRARGTPIYALTNYPTEAFVIARKRFEFLDWFLGMVVSGEEKVAKPDSQIYAILIERYKIDPRRAVFIDDSEKNVAVAQALGFIGIQFTSPATLRLELQALGLLQVPGQKVRKDPSAFSPRSQ
jgi:2-haloacid dehalogenase